MPRNKNEKALITNVDEAVGRFTASESSQMEVPKDKSDLVPLVEDDSGHRFILYQTKDGPRVELRYEGATFWASQGQMAAMFGVKQHTVSEHIARLFADGELEDSEATHRKFRLVRREGARDVARDIDHYDLNVLISVGYRVGSIEGTLFRMWATDKLFQILTKGFYVDKERLMNRGEPDVLDEFKTIARQIRSSIRNSYREVLQLCTLCSDYDGSSESARNFFMGMENKLLWAAADKTAPQLILERADADRPDMGLTYYAGRRGPTQKDAVIGNNDLAPGEQERKGRITEMWLTYIEEQLDQGRLPTMVAVTEKLDGFIRFNQWAFLQGRGTHSREDANAHAVEQLDLYRERVRAESESGQITTRTSRKPRG